MLLEGIDVGDQSVTIPGKLKSRIRTLAKEDADLLAQDRAEHEQRCLRVHHLRIWQKLRPAERALLKQTNAYVSEYGVIAAFAKLPQSR